MSLQRAKKLISDPFNKRDKDSKNIVQLCNKIKTDFLSIDNILKFKNRMDYLVPEKRSSDDSLLIVIDTETTGLMQENKLDVFTDSLGNKHEYISYRNQIREIGAVSYNWDLNFEDNSDKTFFHGKIKDSVLDEYNSVEKIEKNLISKFQQTYLENKENIINAFSLAQEKSGKFNPDYQVFKSNFPSMFESLDEFNKETLIKYIFKYNLLQAISFMNHSDKEIYKYPFDHSRTYKINNNYSDELHLIESLFDFIESKKKLYSNVIIGAHNLPYDEGMIKGAITSAIDYYTYINENPSKKEYYGFLLERHKNIFYNKLNTIDIFKDILNTKKYGNRLVSLYSHRNDLKKVKMLKHIVKSLSNKKYSSGSFSVALGSLAPLSLNQDFHTTINDIYVTMETLKYYFCIPIILDYNHKLKISDDLQETIGNIL